MRKNINNIKYLKKYGKETTGEEIINKKHFKFKEENDNKVNLSFDDTINGSTKRNILPLKKNKNS